MTPDICIQCVDIVTIAAGTAEDRYYVHGLEGEWLLEAAWYVPATTDAADASNYTTLSLLQGATSLGTLTNASTAFTAGTAREFSLSGAASLEFGESDVLNLDKAETGTGGILDGCLTFRWRKARV